MPSAPVISSKSQESRVPGCAGCAQCVPGIIRISWNYSGRLAGRWWRVNSATPHSLTHSLTPRLSKKGGNLPIRSEQQDHLLGMFKFYQRYSRNLNVFHFNVIFFNYVAQDISESFHANIMFSILSFLFSTPIF